MLKVRVLMKIKIIVNYSVMWKYVLWIVLYRIFWKGKVKV